MVNKNNYHKLNFDKTIFPRCKQQGFRYIVTDDCSKTIKILTNIHVDS